MTKVAVAALFCSGLTANCARVGSITGGPKDTLPPVVVNMQPAMATRNFDGKSVYVEFDEYVVLRDLQKEFYTSPGMKKKPTVTVRGRGIRIDIHDTLKPDRTYSLNLGNSVVDNHEGNPLSGLRYVFSTGGEVDSMVMSGYTVDAGTGDSVSKTFVYFFDAELDSDPDYDSVIFKHLPEAIGRAENNGIFLAENLKPKFYRVYAVQDENNNGMYDAGVDGVGFTEGVHNPAEMPGFEAWYDTTRRYVVAEPQLYFRMFLDERPARQILVSSTRPRQNLVVLQFAAKWPQIDWITLDGIDPSRIMTEYLKPASDSIALWLDVPPERLPDTIRGEVVYLRPDSLGVESSHTQRLDLPWRKPSESREQQRERERREKEAEEALAEGREPVPEPNPNPFKYTLGSELVPDKPLMLELDVPLSHADSAAIRLTQVPASEDPQGDVGAMRELPVHMSRDGDAVRRWRLTADWAAGENYRLVIPAGALRNVAGEVNDTIVRRFEIPVADRKATLTVDVRGKTPTSEYIVELTDESGRVLDEKIHVRTGQHTFTFVEPGNVRLRITEDTDGNGRWDTGSLVARHQPERVELFMDKPGEPTFILRAGWQQTKTLEMGEIFAPVTMESMRLRLEREEAVRLEKLRKWLEEHRRLKPREDNGGNAMDLMRSSGVGFPGGF